MRKKEEIFYEKGFRVTNEGEVISNTGKQLNPNVDSNGYYRVGCRYNKNRIYCEKYNKKS